MLVNTEEFHSRLWDVFFAEPGDSCIRTFVYFGDDDKRGAGLEDSQDFANVETSSGNICPQLLAANKHRSWRECERHTLADSGRFEHLGQEAAMPCWMVKIAGIHGFDIVRRFPKTPLCEGFPQSARRPDLLEDCYNIVRCIRAATLRTRCRVLTWQEVSRCLPAALQSFLDVKYGIVG